MSQVTSLRRVVGLWGAIGMGLGSILGAGVFVSIGLAADITGSSVVLAVALAAIVATANGLSSAQLAAAHPVSGGTYEYGHRFIHPLAGFSAGWLFLVAKSASAATAALGCAGYALHFFGVAQTTSLRVCVALGLAGVLTLLVARGLKRSHQVNVAIVSCTLIALVSFVVCGWLSVTPEQVSSHFEVEAWPALIDAPSGLLEATALMFVAYTGYGRIATLGEEVRDPAVTIPRAMIATLVVAMLIYISVSATAVALVGAARLAEATHAAGAPLEMIARLTATPYLSVLVALGAVSAMAGVLLNLLLGLSRVLLAMARRHEMPTPLAHIDSETQSPTRAVWVMGLIVMGLTLLGDVKVTWSLSAFNVLVYYGLTNLAALRLPEEARRFPAWVSWLGLVSCFGLTFFVHKEIALIGLAILGLGLTWRALMIRRGS